MARGEGKAPRTASGKASKRTSGTSGSKRGTSASKIGKATKGTAASKRGTTASARAAAKSGVPPSPRPAATSRRISMDEAAWFGNIVTRLHRLRDFIEADEANAPEAIDRFWKTLHPAELEGMRLRRKAPQSPGVDDIVRAAAIVDALIGALLRWDAAAQKRLRAMGRGLDGKAARVGRLTEDAYGFVERFRAARTDRLKDIEVHLFTQRIRHREPAFKAFPELKATVRDLMAPPEGQRTPIDGAHLAAVLSLRAGVFDDKIHAPRAATVAACANRFRNNWRRWTGRRRPAAS